MLLQRSIYEQEGCQCCVAVISHECSPRVISNSNLLDDPMTIEEDFWAELAQIQAESIGWIPLDEGTYLHVGFDDAVIQVVGIAKAEMAGGNVLWLL